MKRTLALCLLFLLTVRGGAETRNPFEVGLVLQQLLPNHFPDFETSLLVYGPTIGIPVGNHTLQVQGLYGTGDGVSSLFLVETNFRLRGETPFFTAFVMAGIHLLHYSVSEVFREAFGGNAGIGFLIPMAHNFSFQLFLKAYLERKAMVSYGGGFTLLL